VSEPRPDAHEVASDFDNGPSLADIAMMHAAALVVASFDAVCNCLLLLLGWSHPA
jgi:hypothetical protein